MNVQKELKEKWKNPEKLSYLSTKLCCFSVIKKTENNRMKFCSVSGCHQNNKYTALGIDKSGTRSKHFGALTRISGTVLNLPEKYSLLIRTFWQTPILYTKLKCLLKKVTFWPNWIIPNTSLLLPEINTLNKKPHGEQVSWFLFRNTFSGFFFCSQAPRFFKTIAFLLPQPSELTFNFQYFRCHNINILPKAGSISAELSSLTELTHLGTSKIPVQEYYGFQGTGSLRVYYKHNS